MGVDINTVRFLAWARTRGVGYGKMAMLGRQQFMGVRSTELAKALGLAPDQVGLAARLIASADTYVEPLFEHLGGREIHSFDASRYEAATHLWDLNEPPPAESLSTYDTVFDGGTLEHVFDFPRALRGALALLKEGGHYLSVTPAHGWLGHGFYQFSPELFQQVFCEANGCKLVALLLVEERDWAPFYEVQSPQQCGGRHKYSSLRPASIAVVAQRVGPVPERLRLQQSDYAAAWADTTSAAPASAGQAPGAPTESPWAYRKASLRRWLKERYLAFGGNPFFDRRAYRKMDI